MTQLITGQRTVLLIQLSLMTIDETEMTSTMTISTTKTTTMSLWNIHWLMHIHLYLLIVHSLFFTYPLKDSTREDPSHDTNQDLSLPDSSSTRQGTTHVSVTADEVLRSTGDTRRKWIGAGKTELDNLTDTNTITRLSPEQRDEIKRMARSKGQKYIELPAKAVFTIKPSKFKIRIVACGNKTDETFGRTSTTDLDTGMLRYLVSWAASLPNFWLGFTWCNCCFPQCTFTNWTHCCTSDYPLQAQSSTSWSCMASSQSHLRTSRGPQFMVRRANRSSDQSDFYFWGGALLRLTVTDPSILVSYCESAVFERSCSVYRPSRSHI